MDEETEGQSDRLAIRKTDRAADRQTKSQTDRQTTVFVPVLVIIFHNIWAGSRTAGLRETLCNLLVS